MEDNEIRICPDCGYEGPKDDFLEYSLSEGTAGFVCPQCSYFGAPAEFVIKDSEGTQVTDISTKEDYPKFKRGKKITSLVEHDHDSYTEGVKILDKAYSNPEYEKLWSESFKKLVPKTGKAETDIGEILRCFSSLSHAYYQNGDIASRMWSNSGYYQDFNDMYKAVRNLDDTALIILVEKMCVTKSERAYAKYMANFYEEFIEYYLKRSINESYNYIGTDIDEEPRDDKSHKEKVFIVYDKYGEIGEYHTKEEAQKVIDEWYIDPELYSSRKDADLRIEEDVIDVLNHKIVVHDDLS